MKTANGNGKSLWLTEWFTENESHSHRIKRYIVRKKTKFQQCSVVDSHSFGRCLILDGEMQSAQLDEFVYHEAIVHPAMIQHKAPQNVLILGGGEGATVRELLKHKTVKSIVMVDIDGDVIDFAKEYMEPWHQGALDDPRLELVVDDARRYVFETERKFDLIISDLPTPVEGGPAYMLYTIEFYKKLLKIMAPGGLFAIQAGSGNLLQIAFHKALFNTLRQIFPVIRPFYAYVPSFDVPWAFFLCSRDKAQDPVILSVKEVDRRLAARTTGTLRFYDGVTHQGLFHAPKYLRDILAQERTLISEKKPVFFYK